MADDLDEFDFSDVDLDDLPENTLQQLESTALQPAAEYALNDDDDDDGDEVINLDDTAGAPAVDGYGSVRHALYQNGGHQLDGSAGPPLYGSMEAQPPRQSQVDVDKLLLRIKRLEQEKRRLNNDLHTATAEASKRAGEADNLRRRADAETRANEQRVAAQQQARREAEAKLKAERDGLRRELEQTKTDHMFMEHEAQAEQTRRTTKAVAARPKPTTTATRGHAATPKKAHKTVGIGDGFDDEDIVMASPSKRRDRSKAATPKQAGKRKRQVVDHSPVPALQLSEPRERTAAPEPVQPAEAKFDATLLRNLRKDDSRFTLLHRLLSHRSPAGSDRVLEALTQYAFPSQPDKKLSSVAYDSLLSASCTSNVHALALSICHVFLELWRQCLQEKYYDPVFLILEAVHCVLACEPAKTAANLTEEIIPLVAGSIQLVATPVFWAAKGDSKKVAELFSPVQRKIAADVNVQDCLELLYFVATSCLSISLDSISLFWRAISSEFVLLLLTKEQPLPHIALMLRILSTSPLPTSFGPIASENAHEQGKLEGSLISRLTNLFIETPTPIPDPQATTPVSISEYRVWQLRLGVLDVLTHFSISEHGSAHLANHNLCIGRLIKYLNYCVTSLYTRPLSPTQDQKIASINTAMKLIHHLSSSNPGFAIKSKLDGTLGGHHAYLVSLTRLAFSEALVLEAGIEPAVIDMAHDILDEGLSPEEGEGLMKVFSSGNSV